MGSCLKDQVNTEGYKMPLYVGIDIGKFLHTACFLDDERNQVKVFNPLKVNRFRDFYIQPAKTDTKDAFVLA